MSLIHNLNRSLILASQSPRRKDILERLGYSFTIIKPMLKNEGAFLKKESIRGSLESLALAKTATVTAKNRASIILGCDTVVVLDGVMLGKPIGYSDAASMLRKLSGRSHSVYTGCALVCDEINFSATAVAKTDVVFRHILDEDIDHYLAFDEYSDKAGAYAIQGKAMAFVDRINGCFYNVMGLPVSETLDLFKLYNSLVKG